MSDEQRKDLKEISNRLQEYESELDYFDDEGMTNDQKDYIQLSRNAIKEAIMHLDSILNPEP